MRRLSIARLQAIARTRADACAHVHCSGADGPANPVALRPIQAYHAGMLRFFDMTDHARLPQRFCRENRSVLARLR